MLAGELELLLLNGQCAVFLSDFGGFVAWSVLLRLWFRIRGSSIVGAYCDIEYRVWGYGFVT